MQESDGAILGAVIPVAPGRMRNIFYPRGLAAYVTGKELRDLREREVPIERDLAFGKEEPLVEGDDPVEGSVSVLMSVDLMDVIGAYFFHLHRNADHLTAPKSNGNHIFLVTRSPHILPNPNT